MILKVIKLNESVYSIWLQESYQNQKADLRSTVQRVKSRDTRPWGSPLTLVAALCQCPVPTETDSLQIKLYYIFANVRPSERQLFFDIAIV